MRRLCHLFGVSHSGYYSWRQRKPSPRYLENQRLLERIKGVSQENRQIYGSPRVTRELRHQGEKCGVRRVARLMKSAGIMARTRRRFCPQTTDSKHALPVAPHVLKRQFKTEEPNQKWVGDITYLPTPAGWLYLAVVLDLYSRRVVGWAVAENMETSLVIKAFNMAVGQRTPTRGLLFHSDRGSQYASGDYQLLLKDYGVVASMSRKGNCWDNAVCESFFHSLKTEHLSFVKLQDQGQAQTALFDYIECFYNRKRLHSSLGYLSPLAFEQATKVA